MDKIKVVHIITLLEFGGAQQNTLYTATHLNRSSFEAVLITGKGAYLDSALESVRKNVRTRLTPLLKRQINPLIDFFAFWKIFYILCCEKPHIVHTHSSKAGILGRWAGFFARVPVIIHTYHGFGFNEFQHPMIRCCYIWLERVTALITDHIIGVSSDTIAYAVSKKIADARRYSLIRSGISLHQFGKDVAGTDSLYREFAIPQGTRILTMVACFKPQKNVLDFVRTVDDLVHRNRIIPLTCLLIGDGDCRARIVGEIAARKLEHHFILPGWRQDIPAILRMTDVFVLTSLWEGLPRAIVEALVSGVPVVANAVDGIKEIIRDGYNGYLCQPGKISEMSDKIALILNDQNLRKAFSRNASVSIGPEFDIDTMVLQQEELYKTILKKNKKKENK